MDTARAAADASEPPQMSESGRMGGVFWDPKPVFRGLAARPRWLVPLVLITLVSVIWIATFSQVVGWETVLRQAFEQNPRLQEIPAEQQARIMEQQVKVAGVTGFPGGLLGPAVIVLLVAALLMVVFRVVAGPPMRFGVSLGFVSYAWLPFVLYQLIALAAMLAGNPADFNLQNPVPFNPGWFLNPLETPAWLVALASAFDLFVFWVMALLALAFSVAGHRLGFGQAFAIIFFTWLPLVLARAGWAALFG